MQPLWMAVLALSGSASAAPDPHRGRAAMEAIQSAETMPDSVSLTAHVFEFAGGSRTRVLPRIEGLDVFGASWVVASGKQGPLRITGGLPPLDHARVRIDHEGALERASNAFADLATPPHHSQLAWTLHGDQLVRAWRVPVLRSQGALPSPWTVWIEASSGQILARMPSAHSSDALVYPTNPVLSVPERIELPAPFNDSPYARAFSCSATDPDPTALELAACEQTEAQARPDANGDYLFVPRPEAVRDPFAEVNAFTHIHAMGTWLDERFGFQIAWAPINVYVNFPLANAFFGDFDGDGLPDVSFGHANGVDLSYDADVVYHEYGHAVVGTLAPGLPFLQADELGLDWVSGSVNEGAADVFAMLLTHDPEVGEYAGAAFGYQQGIRELSTPLRCPDDLLGEVHADGKVFGSMFWQIIQDRQIGDELAGELLMGSIALWDHDVSWPAVGASVETTADDLLEAGVIGPEAHQAILFHVEAANLKTCSRVQTLDESQGKKLLLFNAGLAGDFERIVGNVQLRLDPTTGANQLEVVEATRGDIMGWTAFVRRGAPVDHEVVSLEAFGLTVAIPRQFDQQIDGVGEGIIGPFEGDEPVFIMLASRNIDVPALAFVTMEMTLEASRSSTVPQAARPNERRETQNLGWTCAQGTGPGLGWYALLLTPVLRARSHRRRL